MPAYIAHEDTLCTKMVAFYKREGNVQLPSTQATVLLFNPEYGNVTAVSPGNQQPVHKTAQNLLYLFQTSVMCSVVNG